MFALNPRSLCSNINKIVPEGPAVWYNSKLWPSNFFAMLAHWRVAQNIYVLQGHHRLEVDAEGKLSTDSLNARMEELFPLPAYVVKEQGLSKYGFFAQRVGTGIAFWVPDGHQKLTGQRIVDPESLKIAYSCIDCIVRADKFEPMNREAHHLGHPKESMFASNLEHLRPTSTDRRTWEYATPDQAPKWLVTPESCGCSHHAAAPEE